MQKVAISSLLLLFFRCCVVAANYDDFDEALANLPQMAPEQCALQSPDAMLNKLLAERPKPSGVGDCEGCKDSFYTTYAVQLAKKTDADYSIAKKIRQPLLDCFKTCFDYLDEVHHDNGTKHYSYRISGELEWIIFRGAQQEYRGYTDFEGDDIMGHAWIDDDSNYTPELIRQIAVAIGRANAHSSLDHFETQMLSILDRSLGYLKKAEESMSDAQKPYFRRYLILFITRFP